jgi:hypothetical protein
MDSGTMRDMADRSASEVRLMNVPITGQQIRALAYWLWEEAGGLEGRSGAFRITAHRHLAIEPATGNSASR